MPISRTPKKKLSPRDKLRRAKSPIESLELSRKSIKKLKRLQPSPSTESLELARKLIPENHRLTRSRVKQVVAKKTPTPSITPIKNRFEVFNTTYTPLIESFSALEAENSSSTLIEEAEEEVPLEDQGMKASSESSAGSNIISISSEQDFPELPHSNSAEVERIFGGRTPDTLELAEERVESPPGDFSLDEFLRLGQAPEAQATLEVVEATVEVDDTPKINLANPPPDKIVVEMDEGLFIILSGSKFKVKNKDVSNLLEFLASYNALNNQKAASKDFLTFQLFELNGINTSTKTLLDNLAKTIRFCSDNDINQAPFSKLAGETSLVYQLFSKTLKRKERGT